MMRLVVLCLSVATFLGCTTTERNDQPNAPVADIFAGMQGCFLLYNINTGNFDRVINEQNCRVQHAPFSSFKVALAVMAFDSGALKDETVVIKWDGVKDEREVVNRDHNAKTWITDSVVWFSQRLTPKIGAKKIKKYLADFKYGNQDMSAGLTKAWIVPPSETGPALKISAYEQVDFLRRLWTDSLPVSKKAMEITQDITELETSPQGFELSGKTGSNFYDKERKIRFGWFVSHLQRGDDEYIAVTNFRDLQPSTDGGFGGMKAKEITKKLLNEEGLW